MYAITTKDAPKPEGTYSQGTSAARFVFVSGQLPIEPTSGELVPGGIGQQTARCIRNVEAVLRELELGLADVTKTTIYLTSLRELEQADEVYAERFPKPAPARSCVEVGALPHGAQVMVEAIACR